MYKSTSIPYIIKDPNSKKVTAISEKHPCQTPNTGAYKMKPNEAKELDFNFHKAENKSLHKGEETALAA